MSQLLITRAYLDNIADAIRGKNGTTNTYTPPEMADAITNIPTGQVVNNQAKTFTPSETSTTITFDTGYTGLSKVTVAGITSTYVGTGITRRSSLTVSGAQVTANAGYYQSNTTATVTSGSAGTPVATKGTVSNHQVTVTPSVTNTTGYITGGTKTGTAVTVAASELVSGTTSIVANDTSINVTNYQYANVSVPLQTIYTGSGNPSSSVGSNGDVYIKTS